jgi:uncharacterized protein (TIGR02328 family)
MRLWHYELLPYLPDAQFKGQLRELVAIMHDWRDKGKTNHLLINRVMDFTPRNLTAYFMCYEKEYKKRYGKPINTLLVSEFTTFAGETKLYCAPFKGWHCHEYLRVCMANLYEKHFFGVGKSRITDEEWARLCEGYKAITGEEYEI